MGIHFLDMRLSVHRNNSTGAEALSTTPLLIGDIGLQTVAAIAAGNAGNVRVALTGTVGGSWPSRDGSGHYAHSRTQRQRNGWHGGSYPYRVIQ